MVLYRYKYAVTTHEHIYIHPHEGWDWACRLLQNYYITILRLLGWVHADPSGGYDLLGGVVFAILFHVYWLTATLCNYGIYYTRYVIHALLWLRYCYLYARWRYKIMYYTFRWRCACLYYALMALSYG